MSREEGGASAEKSLFLTILPKGTVLIWMKFPYSPDSQLSITHSSLPALIPSFLNNHWVVFVFSLVAVWGTILDALAGSYFEIILIPSKRMQL